MIINKTMNTNIVKIKELISQLDPTTIQCSVCKRCMTEKGFSYQKYWNMIDEVRTNSFTIIKSKDRWSCNKCRKKDWILNYI